MFIATDGSSASLPKDVVALAASPIAFTRAPPVSASAPPVVGRQTDFGEVHGGPAVRTPPAPIPEGAAKLDRWDVQSHQYTTKAEVETSILGRLFSGKGQFTSYGVVQEAKRYCVMTTTDGTTVEYGTAVRLSVGVLGAQAEGALTLPNIAAKAQLTGLQARIALSVVGYVGPLGELLPAPDNLNVENLAVYTTAFRLIQAKVFGAEGLAFISPALLGYNQPDGGAPAQS